MNKIDLSKPIQAWEQEPFGRRIDTCRFLLYAHGFISEKENKNVIARIKKAVGNYEKHKGGEDA